MTYIRNADLTLAYIQQLVQQCGYEDITLSVGGVYAFVVRMRGEEIIGFATLPAARRLLTRELRHLRAERVARGEN